ncbi:MAG: N-acetylmuramoyl-L-alanine amidase [Verrucomicrobiota bacterium]|nr:N-acetylmuramoyl-L-alanine amidase [Verrucomicrobiota bacterium]
MIIRLVALALLLLARPLFAADHISVLGKKPDWTAFEKYQETITHDEFARVLQDVYCTRGVDAGLIQVEADHAQFLINRDEQTWFTLRFAANDAARKKFTTPWKHAAALPTRRNGSELAGLKIALDPGHIGGRWAKMEERWYQVGDSKPVQEGDMTLLVSKLLAPKLRAHGATVLFVRDKTEPVTSKRPDDLREVARAYLVRNGTPNPPDDFTGPDDPEKEHSVRWESELLFYRQSEIRARAEVVNAVVKPDVVLCLHFNAEAWDDPRTPRLIDRNHLHLLVNGAYSSPELEFDDVRFEMLERLLSRVRAEELPLAERAAAAMAFKTHLPPYEYTTDNVTKLGATGYLYARNLIATRLYDCPVVYYEPYVMNSNEVFWRIQEGDYEGVRNVNGTDRPSIFREYADGVLDGLLEYYGRAGVKTDATP